MEVGPYLPHTDRPVYRVPYDGLAYGSPDADYDLLYDLDRDPDCMANLYYRAPRLRKRCTERLVRAMECLQVPEEHFLRLGLKP